MTKEQILNSLKRVIEPDLKKDLVSLNMIDKLIIQDTKVSFDIVLTTPACPLKNKIKNDCISEIKKDFPNTEIEINFTSKNINQNTSEKTNPNGVKNIILVIAGKGGVGKSTVSSNIALGFSLLGAKVGLVDADIYGPSIPKMFKIEDKKPLGKDINGVTKMLPIEIYGIKVISIGFFAPPNQAIPWRGPMASKALTQLIMDVEWGELDYLIVDMPPGTGDIHLSIASSFNINGAIIVTTPQEISLIDVKKSIQMLKMDKINIPLIGIIENMSFFTPPELPNNKYYLFGKDGGKKLSKEMDLDFLGELPILQEISEASDNGKPLILKEDSIFYLIFLEISKKIIQKISILNFNKIQDKPL